MTLFNYFLEQLQIALTFSFGILFQILFLLLPIDLRNWHDDLLNVLTYLAVQSFSAGVLFFILPGLLDVYSLSFTQGVYMFIALNTLALLRVVWKIPLERSYPVNPEVEVQAAIVFSDLYHEEKNLLLNVATAQAEANSRVEKIRQKLVRITSERGLVARSTAQKADKK